MLSRIFPCSEAANCNIIFRGFVCLFTQKQTYLVDKSSAFLRSLAIIPFFSGFGTGALRKLLMLVM